MKSNSMRRFLLLFTFSVPALCFSQQEPCPLETRNPRPYTDIQCLFYLGTAAYRAGVLEIAAAHWQVLADMEPTDTAHDDLIYSARANLGHFTYYGIAVDQDKKRAVQIWHGVAALGELSAMSYLGVAYSDQEFSEQDDIHALAWFKTLLVHSNRDSAFPDIDERMIVHTKTQVDLLEEALTSFEIREAERLAQNFSEEIMESRGRKSIANK